MRPLLADRVVLTFWVMRLRSSRWSQAAPEAPAQEATRLVLELGLSLSWVGMEGAEGKRGHSEVQHWGWRSLDPPLSPGAPVPTVALYGVGAESLVGVY